MKITDYFPPSSPPVLLPEVPLPPSSSSDDQASDRSEGDSGKENEEEPGRELAGGERGPSGRSKDNKSGGGASKDDRDFLFDTVPNRGSWSTRVNSNQARTRVVF